MRPEKNTSVHDLCPANCKDFVMRPEKILPYMTFAQQTVKF